MILARASLGQIRQSFRTWVLKNIRVDGLDLEPPASDAPVKINNLPQEPRTGAFLSTSDVEYIVTQNVPKAKVLATATLNFQVLLRYSFRNPYRVLPLHMAENLYNDLTLRAIIAPRDIDPALTRVETIEDNPFIISRAEQGTTTGDWIIGVVFRYKVYFDAGFSDGVSQDDPPTLNSIEVNTRISNVTDRDLSLLDRNLKVDTKNLT